jgi:hypothetical protein
MDDFTLFASAKKHDTDGNYHKTIIGYSDSDDKQFQAMINWNGSLSARVYLTDSSFWPVINYGPEDPDIMQHFAIVKSGNTYTLYYQGVTVGNMSSDGKQNVFDGDLVLNADNKLLNKILIYNRALSETEINKNFLAIKLEVGE